MANTKEIQRRIKSVVSTKKITRAMEMVAASKMRKAIEGVLKTRTYANLSWTTVLNLSKQAKKKYIYHPLLTPREKVNKVAIILLSSNRGLCGGFNSAIVSKAHQSIKKHQVNGEDIKTDFVVIGKKGQAIYTRYRHHVLAEFEKTDVAVSVDEVIPLATMVRDDFLRGDYDKIFVAYTDYVSAGTQIPRVKQLLPVDIDSQDEYLGIMGVDTRVGMDKSYIQDKENKYLLGSDDETYTHAFTFEPSESEVLDDMIPRLIEVQLFQAMLESNASEHSARMSAMHKATEAADDMHKELVLYYNKARQASITNEIAEIAAGAGAISK
ncbi:ATP synthase F1 subunit gamma [Candidatus Parcubacteria bacterium]|nr:ATP synthase F1 subunit gamma [Patescibacteria group bacterium]MBU4308940.1 ATP synthase F1 subunit gamma [Patescibacteria group bacterium]MBU4431830.1 ATP synthase F1 subunit gamma [Patescibacteria group bacterium]MBU4577300.1 ATP synthase F1 subunit gamma [Patescibacteria group bacterium]MCG2696990.1 ATP synthase F1 subunit gamma [Candidatus Parcubacteria bacterium]